MQNLSINNITHYLFPEKCGTIKGIHCGAFVCLLVKEITKPEETLPLYHIKKVNYADSTETSFKIDIGFEVITSDLVYLSLINSVFVSTSTKIFMVDLKNNKVNVINFSLHVDDKVIAAEWNCEQDSLAVAYQSGRVMVYCMNHVTNELMMLAEDHPDLKGDENVYLGWGDVKKQFKGKAVASYLKESHPPESGYKHLSQDGSISWQLGERYFLVNSLHNNEHIIRVYDNECRLFYTITNVKVPGLCTKSVFRSKHNMLATVCQSDDLKTYVVLHERNGEYYNTILPFSGAKIQDIKFSTCGRIFAIFSTTTDNYHVDLYMQTNFSWLHKFRFTDSITTTKQLIAFTFKPTIEDVYPIEMIFTNGVAVYNITKTVTTLQSTQQHSVFVQTANTLQEFDYTKRVIPPCGVNDICLTINEPINHIIVKDFGNNNILLVLIDALEIAHLCQKQNETFFEVKKIDLKQTKENTNVDLPITWYTFLLTHVQDNECLLAIGIKNNSYVKRFIPISNPDQYTEEITTNVAYVHETINKTSDLNFIFKDNFKHSKGIKTAYSFDVSGNRITCVLTSNGDLVIDENILMQGVTSILNYNDLYLLLTVTSHDNPMDRLYCVDIQQFFKKKPNIQEVSWSRRVEKGAVLICMANNDGGLVLEIPRGNIELINVRPIILRNVYQKIVNGLFLDAYNLIRRLAMKLDMLYDLAPHLFHQNVNTFVKSLGSAESIIKFLLPLKNESTLTRNDFLFVDEHPVSDKKNKICDAIIEVYSNLKIIDDCNQKTDSTSRYRIICIALFVKHNHDTYQALKFLVDSIQGVYTSGKLLQIADVVNMLKIYGDTNEMYKQALCLYDVELAAIVAQVAVMDPQVYRRFLRTCLSSDVVTRRFLMANEGGNYTSAGYYLLLMYRKQETSLDEFVDYIKDKDVLEDVYKAMDVSDDAVLVVSQLLSDKYIGKGLYKEAASVLCKAGVILKAIEVLITGVCWEEALVVITSLDKVNTEEKIVWFNKLANACMGHGKYKEAAFIYLKKCSNFNDAFNSYLLGHLYKDAVDILEDTDLVNKDDYLCQLKDKLIENMKHIEDNIDGRCKMFETHYNRLKAVREDRKHRAECNLDGDDAYSEAGSVTSRSNSTYASTTTRRTRKLEMKLRSLRYGGKFEDIALMRELYDIVSDVFNVANDLNKLGNIYVKYAHIDTGVVFNKIAGLQKEIKQVANDIWIPEYTNLDDDVLTADFLTENLVLLGKEYRAMPGCVNDSCFYLSE